MVHANITKLTEQYINERPSIRDCLKKKLVNYSQLSRQIIKDSSLKSRDFDAVLIAVRRYFRKISKSAAAEDRIRSLLSRSRIEIKNKINNINAPSSRYSPPIFPKR